MYVGIVCVNVNSFELPWQEIELSHQREFNTIKVRSFTINGLSHSIQICAYGLLACARVDVIVKMLVEEPGRHDTDVLKVVLQRRVEIVCRRDVQVRISLSDCQRSGVLEN